MKTKFFLLLVSIFEFSFPGDAQTGGFNELVDSLEQILFSNDDSVEITAFFGNERQVHDSVYYVRSVQPDFDSILPLLKSLAYSKEFKLLAEIIHIYNRQQEIFKIEWEPVLRNNHYACQTANEQFSILEAFEATIHSLKFGRLVILG